MQQQSERRKSASDTEPRTKRRALSNEAAQGQQRRRSWPVRVLTLLLGLQAVLLALIGVINLQGGESLLGLLLEHPFYAVFIPLSILAVIAAIGFLRPRPGAWVIAMMVQGLMLLAALIRYFGSGPRDAILYGMMLYGVIMVLYLNYADVPLVFRVQPGEVLEEEMEGDHGA